MKCRSTKLLRSLYYLTCFVGFVASFWVPLETMLQVQFALATILFLFGSAMKGAWRMPAKGTQANLPWRCLSDHTRALSHAKSYSASSCDSCNDVCRCGISSRSNKSWSNEAVHSRPQIPYSRKCGNPSMYDVRRTLSSSFVSVLLAAKTVP